MYSALCNNCNKACEFFNEAIAYADKDIVNGLVDDDEQWATIEGKNEHYCPDCHNLEWDNEDEYQLVCDKQGKLLGRSKM